MIGQSVVERLAYTALLVVFLAVGIGVYYLVQFDHKLDVEISQLKTLGQQQVEIEHQIKQATDEIKADNTKNTQYLVCIAKVLGSGGSIADLDNCQINPATSPAVSVTPSPKASPPSQAASPQPTPPPTKPSLNQRLQKLLKKVGL